jgi:hypothetical protein
MMKKLQKKALFLLAFIGFLSVQMNAQDETFDANTDALWTNSANWTNTTLPTGTATIENTVDLNGSTQTVKKIVTGNTASADAITISNGTLTLSGAEPTVIDNERNGVGIITFDLDVNLSTTNGILENVGNGTLIFASGNTIAAGSNRMKFRNFNSASKIELNGTITGTNGIELMGTNINWGGLKFGATSDFSGFSGDFFLYTHEIESNTNTVFLAAGKKIQFASVGGVFTVNGANTVEGVIRKHEKSGVVSEGTFNVNANQINVGNLLMAGDADDDLTINLGGAVTELSFADYIYTAGTLNITNFSVGVLKFRTTIEQSEIDAWEIDGVVQPANTYVQDPSTGAIIAYVAPPSTITSKPGSDNVAMNWEDDNTWVGDAAPATGDNVVIKGKIIINSDVSVGDLTISAHDPILSGEVDDDADLANKVSLQVVAGSSIKVAGATITSNDLFANSTSSSFGSLILEGSISGQIQYYKYINATPNNDLIAFPTNENVGNDGSFDGFMDNSTNNTSIYKNPADDSVRLFGPFDNAVSGGNYVNYDSDIPSDLLIPVVAGKGYRIAHATGGSVRFKKASFANTSNITIAITDESDTNATSGEWNLVGNSYPAYMNFTSFYNGNSAQFDGIDNGVYGYDGDGTFTSYNLLNKPTDDKIAPLQGFFVKAKTGGGTLTLNPDWRESGTQDDFIAEKTTSKSENKALARISLKDGDKSYSTDVYFVDNASKGLDRGYDTGAFFLQSKGIYTHLVEGSNGDALAIQALPYEDYNNVSVPLVINATLGSQLSIKIDGLKSTLPSNIYLYLEDTANNTLTILNSEDYKFTADADLKGSGRYYVRFSSKVLSTATISLNKLEIYAVSKTLFINGSIQNNSKVSVFDIQGRLVLDKSLDSGSNSNRLSVSNLGTGVYVIKIINGKQTETKKIIIK